MTSTLGRNRKSVGNSLATTMTVPARSSTAATFPVNVAALPNTAERIITRKPRKTLFICCNLDIVENLHRRIKSRAAPARFPAFLNARCPRRLAVIALDLQDGTIGFRRGLRAFRQGHA